MTVEIVKNAYLIRVALELGEKDASGCNCQRRGQFLLGI